MQGDSAGFFREVCIDKLEFNADGSIKPVIPTVKGIQPVILGQETSAAPTIKTEDPKGKAISTEYYQIDGKRVKKNDLLNSQIYIERTIYDSGSVSSRKLYVKK
jgi:hypothetical protein